MNKARIIAIAKLIGDLDVLLTIAENIRDAEQEHYDNMSEKQQNSEKEQTAEQDTSYLCSAVEGIQQAMDELGNINIGE